MRWLWHALLALGGEYGPAIQQHLVGQAVELVLSPGQPAQTGDPS